MASTTSSLRSGTAKLGTPFRALLTRSNGFIGRTTITTTRSIATKTSSAFRPSASLSVFQKLGFPTLGILSGSIGMYYYTTATTTHPFTPIQSDASSSSSSTENTPALDPTKFISFTLIESEPINHNTSIFRFALPPNTTELGLPVTSCIVTKFIGEDGKPVIRPYTPIEHPGKPYFDLIIKKYNNGPMSTHIHGMKIGETLDMKGPFKKWEYAPNQFKQVGMIAGGTGITPMIQLLRPILGNPEDKTSVTLLFANVTEKDILLGEYLTLLQQQYPTKFQLIFTLDKPTTSTWKGETGFVSKEMLTKYFNNIKPGADDGMVFVCGPDAMLGHICGKKNPDKSQGEIGGLMKELGYTEKNVYKF